MTRDEIDILWQRAMQQAVKDGEMFTRYHFAALVAAAEREARAKVCDSLASPSRTSNPSRSWITEHWIALQPSAQGAKHDDPSI